MSRRTNRQVVTETPKTDANGNLILDELSLGNVLVQTGKGGYRVVRAVVVGTPRGFGRRTAKVATVTGEVVAATAVETGHMVADLGKATAKVAKLSTPSGREARRIRKAEKMAAALTAAGYVVAKPEGLEEDDSSASAAS